MAETVIHLETKRTYLRNLTEADASDFYKLNLDPDVVKYTGDAPFKSINEAEEFLSKYDQYEKYGVGRLAVIQKSSNNFVGWCGLKYTLETDEYDIGFRFFKDYWGKGYATETALKCLEFGFIDLKIEEIVGRSMVENTASINVLEKLGMKFDQRFDFDVHSGLMYKITRDEFNKLKYE